MAVKPWPASRSPSSGASASSADGDGEVSLGHELAGLRPLFAALLRRVITAAYDRAAAGQTLQRPLLLLLDEAANIAPLADLDTIASTAAGTGIQLVTIWQDMAQIHTRYGERAATVVNNHRAKLALSGISDSRTLEYLSRLAGDTELMRHSTTHDPGGGRTTTTETTQMRRLAADDQLRRIRPGEGLLLYGHLPPARMRLRPSERVMLPAFFESSESKDRIHRSRPWVAET